MCAPATGYNGRPRRVSPTFNYLTAPLYFEHNEWRTLNVEACNFDGLDVITDDSL